MLFEDGVQKRNTPYTADDSTRFLAMSVADSFSMTIQFTEHELNELFSNIPETHHMRPFLTLLRKQSKDQRTRGVDVILLNIEESDILSAPDF